MYSVIVDGKKTFKSEFNITHDSFEGKLNEASFSGNYIKINEHQFHFIINAKSYNIDVLKIDREEKSLILKVNTERFQLKLKDKYDELLHNLGLDESNSKKVKEIKAPMPGMVLKVIANEGDTVKKGDAILVLEAMKMENILKSPSDGVIKKVMVSKGMVVEKSQLLIQFQNEK